jgi:hypothetical protein
VASQLSSRTILIQHIRGIVMRLCGHELLLLLLWPWILLVLTPNWVYLNTAGFDTWIYLGHFLNLPSYLQIYTSDIFYYITRLSWVLPGFLAYQTLPPLVANVVLRLFLFYATTFSVYGALTAVHHRAALLASLVMSNYSYFLLATGWDYVDGAGIAYFSLTIWMLVLANNRSRRWLYMLLAGAAATAMITANIFTATFTPCFVLVYLLLERGRSLRNHTLALSEGVLGAVSLLAILGAASVSLGGEFLFFRRTFEFALSVAMMPSNPWHYSDSLWPINSGHLVWPEIIFAAVVFCFVLPGTRKHLAELPHARMFVTMYLLTALIMLGWQLRASTPALQVGYYATYLIPALFLCLGALIAPALAQLDYRRFVYLLIGTLALMALGVVAQSCTFETTNSIVFALVLGAIWVVIFIFKPIHIWHVGVLVTILSLATPSAFKRLPAMCPVSLAQPLPSNIYLGIIDGNRAIQDFVPGKRVYFWYNYQEQSIYRQLSALYLHTWNLMSDQFPQIAPSALDQPGTIVVLLSNTPDALAQANKALRDRDRVAHVIGQRDIQRDTLRYTVTVLELDVVPRQAELDEVLDLSTAGDPSRILKGGWNYPERFGSWTYGPRAEIELLLNRSPEQDVIMTLDAATYVGSFVTKRPTINVHVSVNGVRLTTWMFDKMHPGGRYQVAIPAEVLNSSEKLHITLDIDRPYSLYELGYNEDERPLAFAASRLLFTAAPQ